MFVMSYIMVQVFYSKVSCMFHYIIYNKGGFSQRKNFFVYSPIFTKFGMKVGLRTLTTGKILMSGYHDNGC